jgi:argininosuccinate lyase
MLSNIDIRENILADDKYKYLFSVEEVNKLVLSGVPFRDAYKKVGLDIEQGKYNPERSVNHTHEGSIGNPGNDHIVRMMNETLNGFSFDKVDRAVKELLA